MEIIATSTLTMSSREIAELTGKEHKNVMRDIRNMLDVLGKDRLSFERIYKDGAGRDQQEYHLDRELTLTLVSGYDIPLRHRVVTRVAELEQQVAMAKFNVPTTYPEAMRLAADLAEQKALTEAALAVAAPKAEALDRIASADGSLCLTDAAKELQMRPKDLISWMSCNGWIYKRAGSASWIGYQDRIQSGLLEHKANIIIDAGGNERIRDQVRVTGKGLSRLASIVQEEAA